MSNEKQFWTFVAERHRIFIRRMVNGLPPPWTDDPILQKYRFTNVYRELDRGTRYLMEHVLRSDFPAHDVFWNVYRYRLFNRPGTYEATGAFMTADQWSLESAVERLRVMRANGQAVFSNAWKASPGRNKDKTLAYAVAISATAKDCMGFFQKLRTRPSLAEAHRWLATLPFCGNFVAYELATDCCYDPRLLNFSLDDWAHVGPGAMFGLAEIYEDGLFTESAGVKRKASLEKMRELRLKQPSLPGPPLSLRNVEHSLCEFAKYCYIQRKGRYRRTFREPSGDLQPWSDVKEAYVNEATSPI